MYVSQAERSTVIDWKYTVYKYFRLIFSMRLVVLCQTSTSYQKNSVRLPLDVHRANIAVNPSCNLLQMSLSLHQRDLFLIPSLPTYQPNERRYTRLLRAASRDGSCHASCSTTTYWAPASTAASKIGGKFCTP